MFYFLASSFILVLYLSIHLYYSFFSNYNIFISVLLLYITFIIFIFFSFFILNKLAEILSYNLFNVVQFIYYFLLIAILYCATFYLLFDILKIFIKVPPYKEGILVISLAILVVIYGYINTRFIREVSYDIESSKITQDVRIVLISDIHIGSPDITLGKLKSMVAKVNNAKADIVIIAGDIVNDSKVNFIDTGYGDILNTLNAEDGVFAITGNHEQYRGNIVNVIKNLESLGIKVIDDSVTNFDDFNINLIGRSYIDRTRVPKLDLATLALNKSTFNLLADHSPVRFAENIKSNIDLQVSGHTHSGQIIHGYIAELFLYEKAWGLLKKEDSYLVTSSGVGTWGPPVRDITYPEIVIINLKKTK